MGEEAPKSPSPTSTQHMDSSQNSRAAVAARDAPSAGAACPPKSHHVSDTRVRRPLCARACLPSRKNTSPVGHTDTQSTLADIV